MERPSEIRKGTWLGTYTGGRFDPLNPRLQDVRIEDIARHLSCMARYNGATKRFYSVAEHSIHLTFFVPDEFQKEALLHDAAEAYIGDMCSGLKHHPDMALFRSAEEQITSVIFEKFGIYPTVESSAAVNAVDKRIVVDEVTQLMASPGKYLSARPGVEPLGCTLLGVAPSQAECAFLDRFDELWGL